MPPAERRELRPQPSRYRCQFRKKLSMKPRLKKSEVTIKTNRIWFPVLCSVLIAGCVSRVRTISNSGYSENPRQGRYASPEAGPSGDVYQAELSEFDVLGITRGQA